jgi:glycine/D-amino acid oxidase-like deaminating enzyme
MKDYQGYSFWLETSHDELSPRAPLDGSIDVDVAILGAGFSGLWTAYYLLKREPSLDVAVVEAEIAGFGASGRNGGWCSSQFSMSPGLLRERYGRDAARNVMFAMYDSVDEVGRVCASEGIDAHYLKSGGLHIARGAHQAKANEDALRLYGELDLADHYELLDAGQTEERIRVSDSVGSLLIKDCAVIHPGRLVRGLARIVEDLGGKIYEQTPVIDFEPGQSPVLVTAKGLVRARTIVLAGEGNLTRFKQLNRQLLPMYSTISLTEPLSDEQWNEIGWRNRECVASNRYHVD